MHVTSALGGPLALKFYFAKAAYNAAMPPEKSPYGLHVIEDCLSCPVTKERLFCNLPSNSLSTLDSISSSAVYPRGAVLFVEGQPPRGVFILCSGRVKLSASSAEGKSLIVRVAEAGEIIGLPSTLSSKPYELTAEAMEPSQANFIRRADFLEFLRTHGDAALKVAVMLSEIYYATYQEVRYIGLSGSASEKLARFLLDSSEKAARYDKFATPFTHEEIAERLGTTRETITRLLNSFKREKLIDVRGASFTILSAAGLQKKLAPRANR
jgi:CRP/FNR family transcriptional regulator, cyclic AMP receptor protein